ncbi:VanZ family protein [[Ruminococcus] gnavus]|uniref:VanZ family protein n=1 Tax=Mediterraneibacter gnavus TaxID=33038 RepID=UPI002285A521|nr:VanZ family protein [Mediterraneibacter gnavus]MCZ0647517.1 VanZ family protein [Mediterraneibacter gnavus]
MFDNRGKIRWWHGLLFGIFISGCIEGLQLILCRGLFEFDDMIHNSLGCMARCAIGAGCLKKFNKK